VFEIYRLECFGPSKECIFEISPWLTLVLYRREICFLHLSIIVDCEQSSDSKLH
jgi:hypothetical protein